MMCSDLHGIGWPLRVHNWIFRLLSKLQLPFNKLPLISFNLRHHTVNEEPSPLIHFQDEQQVLLFPVMKELSLQFFHFGGCQETFEHYGSWSVFEHFQDCVTWPTRVDHRVNFISKHRFFPLHCLRAMEFRLNILGNILDVPGNLMLMLESDNSLTLKLTHCHQAQLLLLLLFLINILYLLVPWQSPAKSESLLTHKLLVAFCVWVWKS